MRKHLEDNDSSAVAAVLDQLHEALGDLLHREDNEVLLQHVPVLRASQDSSVRKRGADALDLEIKSKLEKNSGKRRDGP